MGLQRYIWRKGQRYYLYDTYNNKITALKKAKQEKKKNGCRYFIIDYEHGFLFPEMKHALYLNKCIRLW